MDRAETIGTVWLGLTFNCCRCHDHKFDPLTQRDYYGLFAFFNQTPVDGGGGNPQTPPVLDSPRPSRSKLDELTRPRGRESVDAIERSSSRAEGKPASTRPRPRSQAEIVELLKGPGGAAAARSSTGEALGAAEPAYAALLKAQRGDRRPRRLARSIPRVMVMEDMPKPRETFILTGARTTSRARRSTPACPRACRRCRPTRREPPRPGPLARRRRQPADGPRDGQPRLAAVLRHRPGEDGRGLRRPGREAVAPRAARLAGGRVRRQRLGREGAAPADRHQRDLPAVVAGSRPRWSSATRRTACWRAARGSGCRRG